MRKRIVSLLLSLALCLTLPTAAFAEEAQPEELLPGEQLKQVQPVPEEPGENEEQSRQDEDVIAVQALINALPDASELDEMDAEARESACLAASEAYDAYDALTEKQQSALTGAEKMIAILKWANEQVALAANEDLSSHTNHDDWTAINTEDGLKSLTGKGYLTDNITLTSTWEPKSGVVLCLNGKAITGADGQEAIYVNSGGTFTLTDCHTGNAVGQITHKTNVSGCGVYVQYGTFNMYGGSITDNTVGGSGGGVCATNSSTFNMYGGSITGNSASQGGGVYAASTFNMYGGTISGNTAKSNGGGVFVTTQNFTVSGNAKITDNTNNGGSEKNNVYLNYGGTSIQIGTEGLQSGAKIGVTTYATPSNSAPVTIVSSDTKAGYEEYFTSDKEGCYPVYQGGKIVLYAGAPHKHPICGETCADSEHTQNITWTPIETDGELKAASANGYYYLTKDVTLTSTWTPANGVKLCLNGHTITTTANVDAIAVGQNVTFTLTNCKGTGKITHQYKDQDRVYTAKGCGAYVDGGTFHLYGGTFSKNIGHNIRRNTNGGGVYVENSGTFYMYGGSITDNSAGNTNNGTDGGGVYLNGGTFHMSGGSIIGNSSGRCGGGVYVDNNSTFTLSGSASITGNWTNGSGGGVYVSGGIFDMKSGTITGNKADTSGGGVHVGWSGTFHMSGGSITGNNVKKNNGGGVNLASGSFTVSGSASITGNVKDGSKSNGSSVYTGGTTNNVGLNVDSSITIGDGLTGTARIGVANEPSESNPVKIATGATGDLSVYKDIFTPDVSDKGYEVTKDGTDLYLSAHQHKWMYALKEGTTDTITAKCNATGCPASDGGSVTINKPAHTTYGDGKEAAATVTSTLDSSITKSTITYKKGNDILDTAPTDAGTYTASITVGEGENAKTASVEYTIVKATPRVLSWMGYPRGWTFRENTPIANPTELTIANGTFKDVTRFEWYNATKNADNYTEGAKLDGNPTDAGDYIIKAVFEESNNVYAAVDALGLTISKAQHANNGDSIEVPLNVYPVSAEYVYEVDIAKALENIPHGGGLEPDTTYGGISTNLTLVKQTKWDNGKLKVTMKPLASITGTTLGSITVNLTSKNYTVVPVVVNIMLNSKQEVQDISVNMDNWTYGEEAKTPQYDVAGAEATVTYAAKGTNDFNTTVPTNAGEYTVKVQYETDTEIHTGTAEFTIAPKTLTVDDLTYSGPITKVYDGNTNAPSDLTVSVKSDSLVGSDFLAVRGTLKYNSANVNEAKQIIFTPTAITTGNYALAATAELTITGATITQANQAELTVTSTDATYGEDLALTVSGGDGDGAVSYTVTNGTGAATIVDGSKLHPTKAGTVSVTATKAGGDNYEDVTSAVAAITIGQAVYNGTASKTVNIVKGRSTAQTETLTAADFFPEGQMPAGAKITDWSLLNPTTAIISSVDMDDGKLTYLSKENIATASEESGRVTIATTNYKDITATLIFHPTDKLAQDGFKFENGSVTKTYGDEDFILAAAGEVRGSTVTYESSEPTVATVDGTGKVHIVGAGTATITAKASATEDYDEAAVTCTLTVGKKPITAPAADATVFTYNGKPQTYALAENEAYTVSSNVQTNANENGYAVTVSLKDKANTKWAGEGDDTADKTYTFIIKKAAVIITAKDQSAYVGDKVPALGEDSYTVSGLVGEEKLTTQPTVKYVDANGKESAPDMTKTGEVKILASGAAASDNYTIRYEDGKLTVSTRPSSGSSSNNSSYTVSVDKTENGAITVSPKSASKGDTVTITVKPDKGYELDTLEVLDKNGDKVKLTEKNGKYTFTMPAGKVTVKGSFVEEDPEQIFADVPVDAYYYEAVKWAVEKDITGGIGNGLFAPKLNCTRAQIVTFLWRAAGSPEPKNANSFADVSADSYYAKAVAWAVENGITGGTGNGKFSPNATCTREQAVAFLYRASGSPAVSGGSAFSDVATSSYYADAVAWAEQNGVTGGIGNSKFGTGSDCTRAQIVTFLYRAYQGK